MRDVDIFAMPRQDAAMPLLCRFALFVDAIAFMRVITRCHAALFYAMPLMRAAMSARMPLLMRHARIYHHATPSYHAALRRSFHQRPD